eukprot:5859860-Pleurochrysis_carterae.AAC.1
MAQARQVRVNQCTGSQAGYRNHRFVHVDEQPLALRCLSISRSTHVHAEYRVPPHSLQWGVLARSVSLCAHGGSRSCVCAGSA